MQQQRRFWIRFIAALFFAVLGGGLLLNQRQQYPWSLALLWGLSLLLLLAIAQRADSGWLYLVLLIISVLWAAELSNRDGGPLPKLFGVLMLLGGLLLLSQQKTWWKLDTTTLEVHPHNADGTGLALPLCYGYLAIWLGLTCYRITV